MSDIASAATRRHWLYGVGVAFLGFVVSLLLAQRQAVSSAAVEQARFARAAETLTLALRSRIEGFTEIAFGLRGLFIVNPALGRAAFVDAISHLEVETRYPGIKNIAFTRYVSASDKQAFEKGVRADTSVDPQGYPGFRIHPTGDRSEYFVADYLWPMVGNSGIHGLDISAQPANLASMRHSLKTGQPVASAPFDLLQEATDRIGFVIRVPVFRDPHAPIPIREKSSNFLGSVAVTLRLFDVFQQLEREGLLQGLRLSLTDVGSALSNVPAAGQRTLYASPQGQHASAAQYSAELSVYGRKWQLQFHPARHFLTDLERRSSALIALVGGLVSMLAGGLVTLLVRGRFLALSLAQRSGEALKDSEGRWRFAIEGSGDGLWDWNIPQGKVFFSTRWKEMLGYTEDEIGSGLKEWRKRVHPDDLEQAMARVQEHLDGKTPLYTHEHRMACKDASWKWILDRGVVLHRDASGKPLRMIGTHSDITERKHNAQALQQSLNDKEALLKEVHHRVKNNLQVVTSLLRLEGRRSAQADTKLVLGEMQGRIRSMALLHELLYRSGTFASVDLGDYLRQLTNQAFKSQATHSGRVRLVLTMASIAVGMDQAIPCGLLVNELISNSLKHGFSDGASGDICIALQPEPQEGMWHLSVSDTGVGLPVNFSERRKTSLGLQLASDLARQLGGTLEMRPGVPRGLESTVLFRVIEPAILSMPA